MKLFFINLQLVLTSVVIVCNSIDDPYAQACVPSWVKNMNIKGFNLISRVNQIGFLVQHESCECECGLNKSICKKKKK